MRKFQGLLLIVLLPGMTLTGFSQSMSNTDNVITLNNTCINGGMSSGTYTLKYQYYSLDDANYGPTAEMTITGVSVQLINGIMTITAPSGSFPTAANTQNNWSLPDSYNGHITLISGSFSTIMYWYSNFDGTDGFNCVPLPIYFSSFSGTLSGSSVVLHWQTGLESNISAIEIYRSSTGSSYYKIGQVTPTGSNSTYSFTDNNPDASNYYYLRMVSSVGLPGIYSTVVHVACSACHYTPPTPVYCPYTISGTDLICNLESPAVYTLSSAVPNYSTIVWSVDQPSAALLRTYPDYRTQANLLKKNATAAVTISATLSGCSNVISKTIAMGAPEPSIFPDVECPNLVCTPIGAFDATSYNWTLYDYTNPRVSYGSGSEFDPFIGDGDDYQVSLSYTNACGTSATTQVGTFNCPPGTSTRAQGTTTFRTPGSLTPASTTGSVVWPNPTSGMVSVMLPATGTSSTPAMQPRVYLIKVLDIQGVVQKTYGYPGGAERISLDLGSLNNGMYIVQVFDNKTWKSFKVVLAK